jgi:stage II sporulation protein D
MRRFLCLCTIIAVFTVSTPLIAVSDSSGTLLSFDKDGQNTSVSQTETTEAAGDEDAVVRVLANESDSIVTVKERDYIIGCVAAEMPVTYDIEALKAQAVACRTFLKWKKAQGGDESLNGADVTDTPTHQAYISVEKMKEKWGDSFEKYYKKISQAVDSVSGRTITYDGEPIMAVFHALSTGKTEDAKNVWGYEVPYLKSVESEGDRLSPTYSSTLVLSAEEFERLASGIDGVTPSGEPEKYIGKTEYTDAGTVKSVVLCGKELSGSAVRDAFSLKSAAFTLKYTEGSFIFSVSGYGHFVGMSQYGADYLAKQGAKYDEILRHYYTGVKIE